MTITTMTNHTHHCTAHLLGLGQEWRRPGPGHEYPDNSRATRADAAAQCEFLAAERPRGVFSRQLVLRDNLEIRLKGHLYTRWASWFDGLTLDTCSDGTTTIHGIVVDQSALHGLLQKVRDIGLPLISVTASNPTSAV